MAPLHAVVVIICIVAAASTVSVAEGENTTSLEQYIAEKQIEVNPRYRPHYHIAPPVGWMNDPNGFIFYNGEYHLFYQFYPYDSVVGPMHWGHVSSPNLVDWKQLPTALIPEKEQCFSGSAVVYNETLVLVYTGHETFDTAPFYNESQYLAFSKNGVDFTKDKDNPVLVPGTEGAPDFRDPKVWKNGDYWYMVLGSKASDNTGKVLLYRSEDLRAWSFLNTLIDAPRSPIYMLECPDFFELNGTYVLLVSPQGMEPMGDRFKNTFQTGYLLGDFNYTTFEFIPRGDFHELDYGHDFYATQTTEVNGTRLLSAWFGMWEMPHPEAIDGWSGAMTIVRELKLVGDRITMTPVAAITDLREEVVVNGDFLQKETLQFEKTAEIIVQGNLSKNIELLIEGSTGGDWLYLRWDPEVGKVVVNRLGVIRQVEWVPVASKSWRIFLDASSMELFCGEGEVVFSSRIYPSGDWRVTNLSPQTLSVEAYKLRRSVPYVSSSSSDLSPIRLLVYVKIVFFILFHQK